MYTQAAAASKAGLWHWRAWLSGLLKPGVCVFGKVTKGMDVVKKIESSQTKTVGPFENVPAYDVVIEKVTRIK